MQPSRVRLSPRRLALPLASMLLLPGCVTSELWGHRYRARGPAGARWAVCEKKRFTDWEWWRVTLRVLATPGAVGLDVVTSPLQCAALFGVSPLR